MIHAILHQLHDPLYAAIPVFFVFIALEAVAYRFERDEPPVGRGYSAADSRTSMAMGFGALTVGLAFRAASLVAYTALYVYIAPWHAPADRWPTWVILFFLVDFLWYCYHRIAHRVRLVWAAHQAHHSSEYFNFSTATRQKWNQWFETLIWLPLPLLGMPPALVYAAFSLNLIYQFFTHTERIDKLPRPVEFIFNTPSHHRVHHGSDPSLPRPQLRRDPDRLGPAVRKLPAGIAPPDVRPDQTGRHLQHHPPAIPRIRSHPPRPPASTRLGRTGWDTSSGPPAGSQRLPTPVTG